MFEEPETFTCCRCGEVKPFVQAWSTFADMFEFDKYWCDSCEDKQIKEDNARTKPE